MLRRRWIWFGELISDEGFTLRYGNRSVHYRDDRGTYEFAYEDGWLFPEPRQIRGTPTLPGQQELTLILTRVKSGIESDGHEVKIWERKENGTAHFPGSRS